MRFTDILLPALMAVSSSRASPIIDLSPMNSRDTELLINEGIKFARSQDVDKRATADFSLERSWSNEVLFGGAWSDTQPGSSEHAKLSVTCLDCATHGTVTATVTDKHFLHPLLRIGFSGVSAYALLGVEASAGQTFSLNLFASQSPIGIGISGLDVGVVFFVDLVFSLSEAIDLSAGFQVTVPDDAYLEADIFKGDIDDSAFEGLNSQSLPVTVRSGKATFKADLRLRVQAGAEASIDLFDIGAGAVIGIYANIIEFVAVIDKSPTCDVEAEIWWDLNVGAYAHLDVVVDYTTLGPVPTVSTTLLAANTISSCLVVGPTTAALPATTSDAAASVPANSQPVLGSSPAETGGAGVTFSAGVTSAGGVISSAVATNAPMTTDSGLVWAPTFVLTVTESEVDFTLPDPSPTKSGALSSPDTSAAPVTTGTSAASSSFNQGEGSSINSLSSTFYSSSVTASYSSGVSTSLGSSSSVHYSSSVGASSSSQGASTSLGSSSSVYYSSSVGASSSSQGVSTSLGWSSSVYYSSSATASYSPGVSTSLGSSSTVYYSSSAAASSYSQGAGTYPSSGYPVYSSSVSAPGYTQGAGTYPVSGSSAYYSSSTAEPGYSQGPGSYPASISTPVSYTSSAAAAGPTYTSTYTHTMTRCGAPGVMNCPATYQTEVVVTRTTTFCPATATTAIGATGAVSVPIPVGSSKPAGGNHAGGHHAGSAVVVVLTPLPTPVVATFVEPTETKTVHAGHHTEEAAAGHSTTIATTTSTTTITATIGNGNIETPGALYVPSPSVNTPGNASFVGTGFSPSATQTSGSSSGGSSSGSQTPVIAGAGRLSALCSTYGVAAMTLGVALIMGFL
ncbi:hypothetical protein F4802DRAFT_617441 [Xylaria palmicola]|nr:hypothetical protein F4802DRAFT_617441 [Xylaria palmicola]